MGQVMKLDAFELEEETKRRCPEGFLWRKASRRRKVTIRRSQAHELARRGMHQRRNDRLVW